MLQLVLLSAAYALVCEPGKMARDTVLPGGGIVPDSCPDKSSRTPGGGLICYQDCPSGYQASLHLCWERCGEGNAKMFPHDTGLFCQNWWPARTYTKKSQQREIKKSRCANGFDNVNGLCYKSPPGAGWDCITLGSCQQRCSGFFSHTCDNGNCAGSPSECTGAKHKCVVNLVTYKPGPQPTASSSSSITSSSTSSSSSTSTSLNSASASGSSISSSSASGSSASSSSASGSSSSSFSGASSKSSSSTISSSASSLSVSYVNTVPSSLPQAPPGYAPIAMIPPTYNVPSVPIYQAVTPCPTTVPSVVQITDSKPFPMMEIKPYQSKPMSYDSKPVNVLSPAAANVVSVALVVFALVSSVAAFL